MIRFAEGVAEGMLTAWIHMMLAPYYLMTAVLQPERRQVIRREYLIRPSHQPAPDLGPNVVRLAVPLRRR